MDAHEILSIAQAARLPDARVIPWTHRGSRNKAQLVWGPETCRWSLMVPNGATATELKSIFRGTTSRQDPAAAPLPPPQPKAVVHDPLPEPVLPLEQSSEPIPEPVLGPTPTPAMGWSIQSLLKSAEAPKPGDTFTIVADNFKIHEEPLPVVQPPPIPQPPQLVELPPPSDEVRRRNVADEIRWAVEQTCHVDESARIRYELALQARNQNIRALTLFSDEASAKGVRVSDLIEAVILDREARENRMMRAYAIQARLIRDLERVSGEMIEDVGRKGVEEIRAVNT